MYYGLGNVIGRKNIYQLKDDCFVKTGWGSERRVTRKRLEPGEVSILIQTANGCGFLDNKKKDGVEALMMTMQRLSPRWIARLQIMGKISEGEREVQGTHIHNVEVCIIQLHDFTNALPMCILRSSPSMQKVYITQHVTYVSLPHT